MKARKPRVPLYVTIGRCAEIAGCHHTTMSRWAEAEGVIVSIAGKRKISVAKLLKKFPDVHERIVDEVYADS